tara:strand:- start:268 stop:606 length:339 start_codon:yes stop_codon:yes gene_type:complete
MNEYEIHIEIQEFKKYLQFMVSEGYYSLEKGETLFEGARRTVKGYIYDMEEGEGIAPFFKNYLLTESDILWIVADILYTEMRDEKEFFANERLKFQTVMNGLRNLILPNSVS